MKQTETEKLISKHVDEMVEGFLRGMPPGLLEEAFNSHVTGPARIAGMVDAKLREMIPVPVPVLEGVVVESPET